MNVLVTGATGFIGLNLCSQLVQNKGYSTFALIRPTSITDGLDPKIHLLPYDDQIVQLADTFKKHNIEGVVHLASLFLPTHQPTDIDRLVDGNLRLGMHLLEAAVLADVQWFINTSSFWQHYRNRRYSPVALYAATKQAFEAILQYYRESSSLNIVTLELFDTYGPYDKRPKLLNLLKRAWRTGDKIPLSPGRQYLNMVYIDDVVTAYILLMEKIHAAPHELETYYCVSARELLNLRDIVRVFSKIIGQDLDVEWGGKPYRKREIMNPRPLYPLVPGWVQRYSLEAGIRRMFELERMGIG
jgi:nucleoside-diphosphate-sugar epimerase